MSRNMMWIEKGKVQRSPFPTPSLVKIFSFEGNCGYKMIWFNYVSTYVSTKFFYIR